MGCWAPATEQTIARAAKTRGNERIMWGLKLQLGRNALTHRARPHDEKDHCLNGKHCSKSEKLLSGGVGHEPDDNHACYHRNDRPSAEPEWSGSLRPDIHALKLDRCRAADEINDESCERGDYEQPGKRSGDCKRGRQTCVNGDSDIWSAIALAY